MKTWDIVAYTYEADIHCFGYKLFDDINPPEDREGNNVHPIFQSDEIDQRICGTCREIIE